MKAKRTKHLILGLSAIMMIAIGCAQNSIKSTWRDTGIAIDGDQAEWSDDLVNPKLENFSLGVMNDDSHLFITFGTYDQSLAMKILRFGFTVWIDQQGKQNKTYGIKYPSGAPIGRGNNSRGGGMRRSREPDLAGQLERLSASQPWIDIIGTDEALIERISIHDTSRIQVATALSSSGQFVYELRISMSELPGPSPSASASGDPIILGIGFETSMRNPAIERPQQSGRRSGGGRPSGGGSGRRPGGRSRGGRPGGAGANQILEPFEYWTKVDLARANQAN